MVCHGGQRSTVLVMLSGAGCSAARPGWEHRLHNWMESHRASAKITRIDLAHDCYEGELIGPVRPGERRSGYSVNAADLDYDNGSFTNGGRTPDIEHRGNWKKPNGKGRTVYVGHRVNGKYARIYEKGRELGDKKSEWVRVEVELKAVDRIIPFDVLLKAGEYLAATYPAFTWIADRQERILTTQKKTEITYESMLRWLHRQCGAALAVGKEIEGSAEALLQKISKPGEIPARLKIPSFMFKTESVHERKRETLSLDMAYQACLS
jgi:phage replication initiation protein